MRLEDLTIALRPRQPWEAADLGCTLVRRDYGRILLLWLITVVPVWAVLAVLLREHPVWFGLAVWWLKPLYDRLPLFHLSRAAFGARPTLKETLREWPRLWSRFLLPALLWRRFSFIRSFALPVWMLEGQRGRAVGKRVAALAVDGGSSGTMVTWVFIKLEIAVFLGLWALLSNFGSRGEPSDLGELFINPEGFFASSVPQLWFNNVIYLFTLTVMEPFYVGAGFGLYLNSRTKLEGWDIELTFRRLAARLRPAVTAGVLLLVGLIPLGVMAQRPVPEKGVKSVVEEILAKEEFKEHTRTQKQWVYDEVNIKGNGGGEGAATLLGMLFYGVMIVLVAGLLFLAGRWLIQNKHLFGMKLPGKKAAAPVGPRVVMGMDIARESLPDDLIAAAHAAWGAGRLREALSLLYRGALSRLVEHRRLPIRDSDTEDDCLVKVAELGDVLVTDFFRQLTLIWVRAAYAGVEARESEFEQLCREWPFKQEPTARGRKLAGMRGAGVLLLLMMPMLGSCGKGHWEEVTIPLGYKGKARTDPFLAAQMLLEEYGHEAVRKPTFNSLPNSGNGVVILSGEAGIPEARARQLMEWVQDGGHLVYALAGCAPYNDWSLFGGMSTFGYTGNEERPDPVLKALGVKVGGGSELDSYKKAIKEEMSGKSKDEDKKADDSDEESKKIKTPEDLPTNVNAVVLDEKTFRVEFPSVHTLSIDRMLSPGESHTGTLEKATMLDLWHGLGRVTVISHARPLRNRYLDEYDHAGWLLALLEGGEKEVHFIVSLQSSFWSLLWTRAWMPLVGLALVTVIWLWLNMLRFGPVRQVVLHDTKHFTEHISALGQFFYRMKRGDVLLNAAADAVRARAIRKHPYLAQMDDEALVELLAEASTLPVARIRAAMMAQEKVKVPAHEMVNRLQDLQMLKMALG